MPFVHHPCLILTGSRACQLPLADPGIRLSLLLKLGKSRFECASTLLRTVTFTVSGTGGVGAGSNSNVANLEATLNQLLQNLRLSTGSTSAAANSATAAQSSGSQHQLLSRLQQLAQQGAPALVGRMLSAVA